MTALFDRVKRLLNRSRSIEAPPPPSPVVLPVKPLVDTAAFVNGLPGFGSADLLKPIKYNDHGFPCIEDNE